MVTEELRILLETKRLDLIKELTAIDVLLGFNDGSIYLQGNQIKKIEVDSFIEVDKELKNEFVLPSGKISAKGESVTWKDYIFKIVEILKYNVKSNQVAEIVLKSNSKTTPLRAKQVTADKLAELVKEGKVKAIKGSSRKAGYVYELII